MTLASTYYLGCPVFNSEGWTGKIYTARAPKTDRLREYSSVFNTVEGNGVFYGLPTQSTVQKWIESTPDGFRFCLKFPKAISHDQRLIHAEAETQTFLEVLEQLAVANRLGPSFLLLGPQFSGADFPDLRKYLSWLPRSLPFAVEARHLDYFDDGPREQAFEAMLNEFGMERVLLDSRPMHSAKDAAAALHGTRKDKPRSPIRHTALGKHPMVRLVGRDDYHAARLWVDEWTPIVAEWIKEGRTPYFFVHTPDDSFCPDLARMFHTSLQKYLPDLADMPPWPGEVEKAGSRNQRTLF